MYLPMTIRMKMVDIRTTKQKNSLRSLAEAVVILFLRKLFFAAGQVLDPLEAVDLDEGHRALEKLIADQDRINHPCGQMQNVAGDERRREDEAEDEDRIIDEDELGIAAGLDQAAQGVTLIAGTNEQEGERGHDLTG